MMMTGSKSEGDSCHGVGEEKSLIEVDHSEKRGSVCVVAAEGDGVHSAPQLGTYSSITPADGPRLGGDGDGWAEKVKTVEGA